MSTTERKLDFIYILPALLCFVAFLAGVIPCMWCLDAQLFAYISLGIFVVSLVAHGVILLRWRRYKDSSPLAYAITQPVAHLIIMTFALTVGSVNVCQVPPASQESFPVNDDALLFQHDEAISELIEQQQ